MYNDTKIQSYNQGDWLVELQLDLDLRSDVPVYLQIVEQVQRQVLSGQLRPNDQLPTVRQLAAQWRINFNTVARAYRLLDEAGLISTQHGRGTFILEPADPAGQEHLRQAALASLIARAWDEAVRLGYTPTEITTIFNEEHQRRLRADH